MKLLINRLWQAGPTFTENWPHLNSQVLSSPTVTEAEETLILAVFVTDLVRLCLLSSILQMKSISVLTY